LVLYVSVGYRLFNQFFAYRDKKVVGVFIAFSCAASS
jgi:hypothetical protein